MGYFNNNPNGELYLGHIKWSNDYKNVVNFESKSKRNTFFKNTLNKMKNNVIFYDPNSYIDVNGKIENLDNINYAFFKNDSDISNEYYCCFITDYSYIAPKTTRLYIELDIFQMYFYDTVFYKSMIKRGHTPDDKLFKWLAPEPIGAKPEVERQISTILDNSQWEPQWVLHTASYYNSNTGEYEYSGIATENTFGEYGKYINNIDDIKSLLKEYGRKSLTDTIKQLQDNLEEAGDSFWLGILNSFLSGGTSLSGYEQISSLSSGLSFAQYQDHRDELIGLYAIPKWSKGTSSWANNKRVDVDVNISLTNDLACGYKPRNKKMLSSICKAYAIYNRNGYRLPLQPELFTGSPKITLSNIPMNVSSYYMSIQNYKKPSVQTQQIPYSCERRVGYDMNTGLNKTLNVLTNSVSLISSIGGLTNGNVASVLAGGGNAAESTINMVDAIGQQGISIGSNGDLLSVTSGHATLRFIDVSPTYAECEYIDDYFDMYGYEIDELYNPKDWINNRPVWNYIQTENINLSSFCPTSYENKLKDVFNSGVTIWKQYENFGNYSLNNQP